MRKSLVGKGLYKLSGDGQCQCSKCGARYWTDLYYEYNNKLYDFECLENEIKEYIIKARTNIENSKIAYTDKHLQILELKKQEKDDLKNIAKEQEVEKLMSETLRKLLLSH